MSFVNLKAFILHSTVRISAKSLYSDTNGQHYIKLLYLKMLHSHMGHSQIFSDFYEFYCNLYAGFGFKNNKLGPSEFETKVANKRFILSLVLS